MEMISYCTVLCSCFQSHLNNRTVISDCVCYTSICHLCTSVGSATELAVVSSKAALSSAEVDASLIDATFVGNVIQSRYYSPLLL